MNAVPGEKILHSVHSRNRNMISIHFGFGRQRALCYEGLAKCSDFFGGLKLWNIFKNRHASACGIRMAETSLGNDKFRNIQIEQWTTGFPPFKSCVLICGCAEVIALS